MSSQIKKTPAQELLDSLLSEVGSSPDEGLLSLDGDDSPNQSLLGTSIQAEEKTESAAQGFASFDSMDYSNDDNSFKSRLDNILQNTVIDTAVSSSQYGENTSSGYEATHIGSIESHSIPEKQASIESMSAPSLFSSPAEPPPIPAAVQTPPAQDQFADGDKTMALSSSESRILSNDSAGPAKASYDDQQPQSFTESVSDSDKTVAVTGFQIRTEENLEDRVKVSVGKQSRSSGFVSWNNGRVDGDLNQADNLRMAQEKIIELENENERLRRQNEELIAASEIIKERSDLLTSQLSEIKNDQDGLEQSFKNEMTLLKNHLSRKDAELQRAQFKVDELESKLKFDMKKIRVRERELENRLELVRAEKNAISKNKDEQILDLRRKMDVLQMEVDSYRQKCVELNKQIENSQDSFKRTTRALRIAMANLELQEENKVQLKKAE